MAVNDASYLPSLTSLIGFTNACSIVLSNNTFTVTLSLLLITKSLSMSLSVITNVASLFTVTVGIITSHLLASVTYVIDCTKITISYAVKSLHSCKIKVAM